MQAMDLINWTSENDRRVLFRLKPAGKVHCWMNIWRPLLWKAPEQSLGFQTCFPFQPTTMVTLKCSDVFGATDTQDAWQRMWRTWEKSTPQATVAIIFVLRNPCPRQTGRDPAGPCCECKEKHTPSVVSPRRQHRSALSLLLFQAQMRHRWTACRPQSYQATKNNSLVFNEWAKISNAMSS